jgi:hypothetical protein
MHTVAGNRTLLWSILHDQRGPRTLISLPDVPGRLPRRRGGKLPHVSCIYRWAQHGLRGVRLEVLQCGGTKVTSLEALQRFFERLSAVTAGETPAARSSAQRQRAADQADKDLAAQGW